MGAGGWRRARGSPSQGTKQRARVERAELGGKDLEAALFHPRPEMEHSTSPPKPRANPVIPSFGD